MEGAEEMMMAKKAKALYIRGVLTEIGCAAVPSDKYLAVPLFLRHEPCNCFLGVSLCGGWVLRWKGRGAIK